LVCGAYFSDRVQFDDNDFGKEEYFIFISNTPSNISQCPNCVPSLGTIEGEAQERSSWRSTTQFRDRDFPARGPRQSAKQKKSREPGHLPISTTSSGKNHIRSTHFVGDGCWRGRLVVVGQKRGLKEGNASLFAKRNFQPKFPVGPSRV
jgi:hypothetical protein